MKYKRKGTYSSVKEVIEARTPGILLDEQKNYRIDDLQIIGNMIKKAVSEKKRISVVTDYDVDGIMCSLIMDLLLKLFKADYEIYIPRRISDGYGISETIVEKITGDFIITCDNGIAAVEAVRIAKNRGKHVVILDHHLPQVRAGQIKIPEADYILDLQAGMGRANYLNYCGAGLIYKLFCEFTLDENEKDLAAAYAAIATIADMVELRGDNRKIVKKGLRVLNERLHLSDPLNYLLYQCNIHHISEKDIGFLIGPIINAVGRLYDNGGQYCFYTFTKTENYEENIDKIISINDLRKKITKQALLTAKNIIQTSSFENDTVIVVKLEHVSEGVLGLVAGKLAEEFQRPSIVFTEAKQDGLLKGSGRTFGHINLKEVLDQCSKFIEKYGGHTAAAGITIKKENLPNFRKRANEIVKEKSSPDFFYDLDIHQGEITKMIKELEKYAPFGIGNPEIVFCINKFVLFPTMKGKYASFGKQKEHIKFYGQNVIGIGFNQYEQFKKLGYPGVLTLYGCLTSRWTQYQKLNQIEIKDFISYQEPVLMTRTLKQLKQLAEERGD